MRNSLVVFVITLFMLMAASTVNAWGRLGHQTVCDIAWRDSSPQVRSLLSNAAKRMGYKTFASSCTWADQVKKKKSSTYAWLNSLHYMNVSKRAKSVTTSPCLNTHISPRCVVTAIDYFLQRIQDRSLTQRQRDEALLLVGHFVGDVHQPLHVSYKEDLGGNRTMVVFEGTLMPLHVLWDVNLLSCQYKGRWKQLGKRLYAESKQGSHTQGAVLKNLALQHSVLIWAEESLRTTQDIYRHLLNPLPASYCHDNHSVVLQRIQLAGLRLGQMFASTLAP